MPEIVESKQYELFCNEQLIKSEFRQMWANKKRRPKGICLRLYPERIGDVSLVVPHKDMGSVFGCTPVESCSI